MQNNKEKKTRCLTGIEQLTAGAISGTVNRCIIAPLDLLKVRFQIQSSHNFHNYYYNSLSHAIKTIYNEEGLLSFWKGNVSAQIMSATYTAVAFYSFHNIKQKIHRYQNVATNQRADAFVSIIAGSISGASATILSYPFDLLRTRFAVQTNNAHYASVYQALKYIYKDCGIRGYFRGLSPTLLTVVPYISLQFTFYNTLMNQNKKYTWLGPFTCGLIAGTLAKYITMPLDVIKKRLQVEGFDGRQTIKQKNNLFNITKQIIIQDGTKALFRGTTVTLIKAAPSSAITFWVYEWCAEYFRQHN